MILVRHGETTGESSIRLNGSTDVPLSDLGRRQVQSVAELLSGVTIARLVTSPLTRARESAHIVRGDQNVSLTIVDDLREVDFGEWETLTVEEVTAANPEAIVAWRGGDADFRYPGGESRSGFTARVERAAREHLLVPTDAETAVNTVVVLHKGVLKIVLACLLREPHEAWRERPMTLAGIHRLGWTGEGWRLETANETGHLGDLLR